MNIAIRLFIGYFVIVGLAAWFALNVVEDQIRPVLRQATEETLVDTANVLAELIANELAANEVGEGSLARAVEHVRQRQFQARIWDIDKSHVDLRIYVTDADGRVVFNSEGKDIGADYSRWIDVKRVLSGQYGARTTKDDPEDKFSSVMYVAAPIVHESETIGVLTVGKPVAGLMPYLQVARQRVQQAGLILLGISALIGLLFTFWLTWSLNRLRDYAHALSQGRKTRAPTGGGRQLTELARALTLMRERLDGKQYVEHYVQSLTHELKSPLSAIQGAAELLPDMPEAADRARFVRNISEQSARMQQIIERLLALARIEQLQAPEEKQAVGIHQLIDEVIASRQTQLERHRQPIITAIEDNSEIHGDAFLLRQALANLLDNAIDFSPPGEAIEIRVRRADQTMTISVRDHGPGAPDYALPRVFDRFYSLPRVADGPKNTGLGLPFVREVARIHGGNAEFVNSPDGGACVSLILPC